MKSGHNSCNQSAIKRIIPAVAMFALSAVMLSSSTYAWFTMNKEVQMTGLSMSATVGSGMEIALASVTGDDNRISNTTPGDDDTEKGWGSSVVVGQYYEDIGKLRPASSVNGKKFYDATDAGNGGKTASTYKEIDLTDSANNYNMAKTELRQTLDSNATPTIKSNGTVGYYVDIPVYLRTNKAGTDKTPIYCKMKIQNKDSGDLYKAVRVAFIPKTSSDPASKVFGVDNTYYTMKDNKGQAVNSDTDVGEGAKGTVNFVDNIADCVTAGDTFPAGNGVDTELKLPSKDNDAYGHLDFVVRVWIEGESTSCSDATSGQNWNIDLAFEMVESGTGTGE